MAVVPGWAGPNTRIVAKAIVTIADTETIMFWQRIIEHRVRAHS